MLVVKNRYGDLPYIEDVIKTKFLKKGHKLLGFDVKVLNERFARREKLIVKDDIV